MLKNQKQLSFYSFFTKYSLMDDYGFSFGLLRRLVRKILPDFPEKGSIEYLLLTSDKPVEDALSLLNFDALSNSPIAKELDSSIKALLYKIVAFGHDRVIKSKFDRLELSSESFDILSQQIQYTNSNNKQTVHHTLEVLENTKSLIVQLRKNKHRIGTTFHLTVTTRKILEYINQVNKLLNLKLTINSKSQWKELFENYLIYTKNKNSISNYVIRHSDLVALEIVEHTSNKGERYIAESKQEYWRFFLKSLLGGSMIALFALIKISFDSYHLSPNQSAFLYSINYAFCFILVKQFGGIIATKQPAVTASTIAKGIDKNDDLKIDSTQNITSLIRNVSRSQFISIIGNFLMAIIFACVISFSLNVFGFHNINNLIDPEYLIKNTKPSSSLIFFSAIAGVFLATSGLIAGYIDNKVVASNLAYRIRNSNLFFKSDRFGKFLIKKAGAIFGNLCLGFFLGSAFLLSTLLPISIDIRHIAFSSANIGYSIINHEFNYSIILTAMIGALLIGLVNFLVSFSITLYLALKSRGANLKYLPELLRHVFLDFIHRPLSYFFYLKGD